MTLCQADLVTIRESLAEVAGLCAGAAGGGRGEALPQEAGPVLPPQLQHVQQAGAGQRQGQ